MKISYIFIALLLIVMFCIAFYIWDFNQDAKEFCKSRGYEYFKSYYCLKVVDDVIKHREIMRLKDRWAFRE